MKDKRILNFYYFTPYLFEKDGGKQPFNFANWIAEFEEEEGICKTIESDNFTARVDEHIWDSREDLDGVCFVNMRDEDLPSKVPEGRAQEDLDLEDDEYIGEDMYILYDRTKNIFMMQVNRMSLSIIRIADFINRTRKEDGRTVGFIPITKEVTRRMLTKKKIRSIEISCEPIYDKKKLKSPALKAVLDGISNMGCSTCHVKFGVGRSRRTELSPKESQDIIDDVINRSVVANTAKVSMYDNLTGVVEYADLIQNRLYSSIEFEIRGRERLHLDIVFDKMKKEFRKQVFN